MATLKVSTRPRSLQQTPESEVRIRAQLATRSKKKIPVSLAGPRSTQPDQED